MKSNTGERERFQKPFSFLSHTKTSLPAALQAVFQNFQPEDFSSRLNQWQRMALANDQSAYDAAAAREDLMDVTDVLKKLVECWHIIFTKKFLKNSRSKTKLERLQRKILAQHGFVYTLTKDEQAKPMLFLRRFCRVFDRGYIETELLDMLDAVITYNGINENDKGNLVFFYQHLLFLVKLSYKINRAKPSHLKQTQHVQQ
ncbi:hypothetical protein [Agriterribacter sp.]|uniref:hypothetical protein n=1 Tax=Agriterribacter sp. TaxID=2821509 RepID=UPI002B7FD4D0|nr:hypothetical protein [Agriterribacter sp.]HRP58378.1 hypothetical protein [Agriterribacter sp.]